MDPAKELADAKARELDEMTLDELVELNTHLSNVRREAGGNLRQEVYLFALRVNEWITQRSLEREQALLADPARASLRQGIGARGFDGGSDKHIVEALRKRATPRQRRQRG
jgi:hypothetical protein